MIPFQLPRSYSVEWWSNFMSGKGCGIYVVGNFSGGIEG